MVNHGLIPVGVSLKTGRRAVFFTVVNSMDNQDGLERYPMRHVTSKNRAIQKYFETISEHSTLVQFEARSTKRTAILSNKIKRSYSLRHTACRVHWRKRYAWRPRISFIKGKAWFWDHVLFLKLIRKVVHKIYLYKKQDHFGNRNEMRRATGKPEATLMTAEYLVYRSQRWICRMRGDKKLSQSWSRYLRNISMRNNSLNTWVKLQEINRFSEESQKLLDDMNQKEIFELWREFRQTSMSWLQCLFRNRNHSLHLREKFEVVAESYNNPETQLRLYFNPWLCH